jgi:hypothetical protein
MMKQAQGKANFNRVLKDQRGMLTLDFIFALMVSIGFAIVFFSIAVTLSLVEVAQYVTYTTSRAYAGAHETKGQQEELARARFDEVMATPAVKTFLGQQWMKLGPPQLGDYGSEYPDDPGSDNDVFVGARIPLDAKLLHLNIPFLGSTAEDSNVGKATLNSYLDREVTTTECREQFTRQRFQQLKNMSGTPYGQAPGDKDVLITDNGC